MEPPSKFLNKIKDPDQKRKIILEQILKDRGDEDALIRKQLETNNFNIDFDGPPQMNIYLVSSALLELTSLILAGYASAIKKVNSKLPQKGGTNGGEPTSLSSASTDVAKTAQDVKGQAQDQSKEGASNKASKMAQLLLKRAIKTAENLLNMYLDWLIQFFDPNLATTPYQELSPEFNKKLILLASVMQQLSINPATQAAVKQIAEAYTTTILNILEAIKPEIEKITDKGLELYGESVQKGVRGVTETGVSFVQSFLAAIPWVGGIMDFIISLGKGFNTTMELVKVMSDKGGPIAVDGTKAYIKGSDAWQEGAEDRDKANKALTNLAVAGIDNPVSQTVPSNIPISDMGGVKGGGKKMSKKYKQNKKRLSRTIKRFNSVLPKMKYHIK